MHKTHIYKYIYVYLAVIFSDQRLEKGFLLGICHQQKGAWNVLGANEKRTKYVPFISYDLDL